MKTDLNILLVDDEAPFLCGLQEFLSRHDCQPHAEQSPEKALLFLKTHPVDLLITDLIMPGMDGYQFIHMAKKKFPLLKIIAMSGGGIIPATNYLSLARFFNIDEIIEKPFGMNRLLDIIIRIFPS